MSLLLEALKKAEKAKQEQSAKPGAPELGPGASMRAHSPAGLSLEELPPPGALKPKAPAGEFSEEQRKGAEAMFAVAKRPEQGQKTVIVGLLAVLLLVFAGGGIYVWREVSRSSALAIQARGPMAPAPIAKAPVTLPAAAPASSAAEPVPAPQALEKDEKAPAETPARSAPARRVAAAEPEAAPPIQIKRTQPDTTVNPALAAAYEAFNAGDLARAEQGYLRLLGAEPRNRDALLGLAAIALMRNHNDEAERHYLRLLEQDPRDPLANAGLMGIRTREDPRQIESRLKLLIAQQPEAAALHFSLGNVYAGESRWAEAQQAYFRAMSSDSGNADYAFNLAVSLDHLNQNKHAADYYRRALALAARGPAGFDRQRATNRLRDLEQFP